MKFGSEEYRSGRKSSALCNSPSPKYSEEGMMYQSEEPRLNLRRSWYGDHFQSYSTQF